MSINHFSTDLPEGRWWAQQQQPSTKSSSSKHNNFISHPNSASNFWTKSEFYHHPVSSMACTQNSALHFDLNNEDDEEIEEQMTDERENSVREEAEGHFQQHMIPKERLFEKPLTPSDVGKLNRLVIPKQHAEKYFPLNGNDSGGEKGLLLSFEDELGNPWRFRYSYWNSSQSYVLTKGWSRFVKEKRLDAGDIVLFERHRLDGDRLFIGWRRRRAAVAAKPVQDGGVVAQPAATAGSGGGDGSTGGWIRLFFSGHPYPPHPHGPALPYQPDCLHAASVLQSQTTPSTNSKRLRLFGVNLECQPDEAEPPPPDGSSASRQDQGQDQGPVYPYLHHHNQQYYPKVHGYSHHNHMDINFSRDVNQTRYRQG